MRFARPHRTLFILEALLLFIGCLGEDYIDDVEFEEARSEDEDTNRLQLVVNEYSTSVNQLQNRNTFLEWLLGLHQGETEEEGPELEPVNLEKCEPCTCGVPGTKIRIVGGKPTPIKKYTWMVVLMYRGRFYCGASLINKRYLLTAAHCVDGFSRSSISARLMEYDRNQHNETVTIDRNISRVIKHSLYSETNFNNDIALLRMNEEVEFVDGLVPVCLPQRGKSFSGHDGLVMGWGVRTQGGSTSPVLHEVSVPIMSNADCRKTKYGPKRITDNMICAGLPEGKKDACQGDSGGPMHIVNGTQHDIVGIVSWGEGCAREGWPGVYARVNRYLTWIARNTADACPCYAY